MGEYSLFWARIGIAAVTFLPILGLHLISIINKKTNWIKYLYLLATLFAFYVMFSDGAISGASCGGNYVVFYSNLKLYWLYSFYYFGALFASMLFSYNLSLKTKTNSRTDRILYWFNAGYLSFILPMSVVYAFFTKEGIPSVMCGFAIIFALILALRVIPLYYKNKSR